MASTMSSEQVSTSTSETQDEKTAKVVAGSSQQKKSKPAAKKTSKLSSIGRGLRTMLCGVADDSGESSEETSDSESKDSQAKEDAKDKSDKPEDQTMKCEIKHLDRRYNSEDEPYFAERKKDDVEQAEQKDWWRLFAFCVVRRYDSDGDLDDTQLYVNPQPLRQLLKDVIGNYPSDPIDVDDVQIASPYHSLFHYREEIESVGMKRFEEAPDEKSLEQLKLLLSWIKKHFELEIAAHEKCLSLKAIAYDKLWTLFPPRTVVHCKVQNVNRAFRVMNYWYDDDDVDSPGLNLRANFVDFDGEKLGLRGTELFIPKYGGTRELSQLDIKPIDLLDEADEVRAELAARGRKFEEYMGQHFMSYNGIGLKRDPKCKYIRFNVSGRVMIDCKTFHRIDPNDSFWVFDLDNDKVDGKLSDEDVLLANAMVRGYAFSAKNFLEFFLDKLEPIAWNTRCFDDLVLDAGTKKTVQALVSTHSRKRESDDSFDDIVKGKGQGLVCVLHGPPGVGKTLTAECVAEFVKRPLFMVSSGDLGITSEDLDAHLTRIMDMTSTWRAVLLIDEADVFLETRSLHDMHRNAMVSVFLRVLEYYTGILFLTTNRVRTFDDAFKSRIHIPIRYTNLDVESRLQIWRNFCSMVPGGVEVTKKEFAKLAEHDLNGRQIKNVIKAAESLASFDGVKLDFAQLEQVTKIQATFEKDLTSFEDIDYSAKGAQRKDADRRNMYF